MEGTAYKFAFTEATVPIIDLPRLTGCTLTGKPPTFLVTEFARITQGFAVDEIGDIVRLEWDKVLSAEAHSSRETVTSIARLDGNVDDSRLAQLLDAARILWDVLPGSEPDITEATVGCVNIARGAKILAADDSGVARSLIEQSLTAMGLSFIMLKTGHEAWNVLKNARTCRGTR